MRQNTRMLRPAPTATLMLLLAAGTSHAIDSNRGDVQAYVNGLVREQGLDADYLLAMLENAKSQPAILEAMAKPAERSKTWAEYRAIFMTPERIKAGVEFWQAHAAELERVAAKTGVPPEMLVGILGVETYFGRRTGKFRVLDSLATLAFDYPPRSRFFSNELTQFFLLARDDGLDVETALGSYAGAMGAPQFMPSSYRNFAVDGDGDGRRDLFNSWPDVLASIANYFVAHDWKSGEPVVARGTAARKLAQKPADNKLSAGDTVAGLRRLGLRFSTDQGDAAPAGLLVFDGDEGLEYWAGFRNFFVITRYNRSSMYGLVAYQLGQAIGEGVRLTPDGPLRTADAP
ncbi:MAG: lytic murein transglycosylase B [Proteobacteria bacterium]|jgi:membrane-bound lytic murein transglycosylase B|nr:MAG: lytic murein transglycosylase B [Pseudomonadota bacterium]MBC6946039.1 lytic murein transglycosylase B [Gammaproteobacteria bacterium]MCE7896662.1 lytic murein transglycosylase B [Gammaproteobacteria bacterium PRO8]MDL1881987.1 lytic murein transglycosylase B [Gammaproteobacteria bacterium PRO2]